MAKDYEVLGMLIPQGGWVMTGEGYENIEFLECDPITKEQFEAGFAEFDAMKAAQDLQMATDKAALLDRLGITAEEAALLLK
jgi:hypothetical protein